MSLAFRASGLLKERAWSSSLKSENKTNEARGYSNYITNLWPCEAVRRGWELCTVHVAHMLRAQEEKEETSLNAKSRRSWISIKRCSKRRTIMFETSIRLERVRVLPLERRSHHELDWRGSGSIDVELNENDCQDVLKRYDQLYIESDRCEFESYWYKNRNSNTCRWMH